MRVQLGANDAYIAWSGAEWYCQNVPHSLQAALSQLSSQSLAEYNRGIGRLTSGTISNVAWHGNGTYYLKNNTMNIYEFQSNAVQKGWYKLWDCNPWDKKKVPNYELKDLIVRSFSPHGHRLLIDNSTSLSIRIHLREILLLSLRRARSPGCPTSSCNLSQTMLCFDWEIRNQLLLHRRSNQIVMNLCFDREIRDQLLLHRRSKHIVMNKIVMNMTVMWKSQNLREMFKPVNGHMPSEQVDRT